MSGALESRRVRSKNGTIINVGRFHQRFHADVCKRYKDFFNRATNLILEQISFAIDQEMDPHTCYIQSSMVLTHTSTILLTAYEHRYCFRDEAFYRMLHGLLIRVAYIRKLLRNGHELTPRFSHPSFPPVYTNTVSLQLHENFVTQVQAATVSPDSLSEFHFHSTVDVYQRLLAFAPIHTNASAVNALQVMAMMHSRLQSLHTTMFRPVIPSAFPLQPIIDSNFRDFVYSPMSPVHEIARGNFRLDARLSPRLVITIETRLDVHYSIDEAMNMLSLTIDPGLTSSDPPRSPVRAPSLVDTDSEHDTTTNRSFALSRSRSRSPSR